jgi:hypothetical protein
MKSAPKKASAPTTQSCRDADRAAAPERLLGQLERECADQDACAERHDQGDDPLGGPSQQPDRRAEHERPSADEAPARRG